ncbi:YhcG family protein [Fibrobacter succinogenes]|jgi:predicted nuclease of restriction endonuclease-like (RecB) superfamily|uniref:PDDEXK nuclease domain-containing protein n=1 Tax=Fibrobacter succinogenes TaxID=833 RepID=UPI00156A38E8|nr:PDDEXK nuclease domain-containing protein [Fibrobacter succinogenes]
MEKKEIANKNDNILYTRIAEILERSRSFVATTVNTAMVKTYYEIGRIIVEDEQKGQIRADYGKEVLKNLSKKLTEKFGKGFSTTNLKQMRDFYQTYQIGQTVSDQFSLSWSHYLFLMRIDNPKERQFYEIEAKNSNWSLRELKRQFDSALYERLALSKDKTSINNLSKKGIVVQSSSDIVKDPYVLEFLGLPEKAEYSETDFENKLIGKLESFLLELGKGYTFVGRQVRLTFDEKHFFVDLVFYNRILQCFVLIDLKIGEITHQDLGQMQMYVHYYDRFVKLDNENKTIGIVLCKKKSDSLVEITLPEDNTQIFASKYQMVLPNKEELIRLIEDR